MNNRLKIVLGIFSLLVIAAIIVVVIVPYVLSEDAQAVPIKGTSDSYLTLGLDIKGHLSARLATFPMQWQIDLPGEYYLLGKGNITTDLFGNFEVVYSGGPTDPPLHYGTPLKITVWVNESGKIIQQNYNTTY